MFQIALFVGIFASMFNSNLGFQLGDVTGACINGMCQSSCTCYENLCYYIGSTCTDANASCATWVANGFCNSTFYTTSEKIQYCEKSCKFC